MKLVHKLLLVVVMMTSCIVTNAASLTAMTKEWDLKYWSVDANNNPVELSEKVIVNVGWDDIRFIMLSNHPTTTDDKLVPTGSEPQIGQVKYMCDTQDRCMVVAPDYLGYGASKDKTHPYMCSTLTARNIVDGLLAAMDFIVQQQGVTGQYYFADNYYTLNVGYSQGGAATLAVQKYLETEASQAVRDKVKLKKSICGAGPHLQTWMFDQMEGYDDMFYSLYIPYTIEGLKYTFGNSTMRALEREEIYTEKFLNSGLLEKVLAKNTVAADMNSEIAKYFGGKVGFYDIIREEYRDRNSKLYRTLRKALTQCDLLDGWTPQAPIDFYHWKGDEVVPYHESEMAYDRFKSLGCNVTLKESDAVSVKFPWSMSSLIGKGVTDDHMGRGIKFYLSIFSGTLR